MISPASTTSKIASAATGPRVLRHASSTAALLRHSVTRTEPLLPRLAVPVMFLTGEYDEMMPSEIALLARLVPDAVTRIVPGAGHSGCLDNPEDWVGEVRRFTNRYG